MDLDPANPLPPPPSPPPAVTSEIPPTTPQPLPAPLPLIRSIIATSPLTQTPDVAILNHLEANLDDSLDAFWLLHARFPNANNNTELAVLLGMFLRHCTLRSQQTALERLDLGLLENAGVINKAETDKRARRVRTNDVYRQRKFNLEREDAEGFCNAITFLHSRWEDTRNIMATKAHLLGLIGYFKLDPNRVIDVMLDALCFTKARDPDPTLRLMDEVFTREIPNLSQILGFKFQRMGDATANAPLFRLAAMLLSKNRISLEQLSPHMMSPISALADFSKAYMEREQRALARLNKSLANPTPASVAAMAASIADDERAMVEESAKDYWSSLLAALLQYTAECESGQERDVAWSQAVRVMDAMESVVEHRSLLLRGNHVRMAYVNMLKSVLFASSSSKPLQQQQQADTVTITAMLSMSHTVLGEDAITLHAAIQACKSFPERIKLLEHVFLPSIAMLDSPVPPLVLDVWELYLKDMPYEERFDLYGRWRVNMMGTTDARLIRRNKQLDNLVMRRLKRLSAETTVISGRDFAKVAHVNPFVAFDALLSQLQIYDNLIPFTVKMITYLSPFGMDVLSYCLVSVLSNEAGRKMIEKDGFTRSKWLSSLCRFAAMFHAKYLQVDLNPLIAFVTRRSLDNQSLELLALQELVAKMYGVEILNDFSPVLIRSLAGGELLRYHARVGKTGGADATTATLKSRDKTITKLKTTLEESNSVAPLLVSMARIRSGMYNDTYDVNGPDSTGFEEKFKSKGNLFDSCTSALVHFSDFVFARFTSFDTFAGQLPSLITLCKDLQIEPVSAFHITRPLIRKWIVASTPTDEDEFVRYWGASWSSICTQIMELDGGNDHLSVPLYKTFWLHTLHDIFIPTHEYEEELKSYRKRIADKSLIGKAFEARRHQLTQSENKKLKEINKELDTLRTVSKQLEEEFKSCQEHVQTMKAAWTSELTDDTNPSPPSQQDKIFLDDFIRVCVIPRLLFTPEDALYCVHFLLFLHEAGKIKLWTCLDRIFEVVPNCLFSCTEGEAASLAHFFNEAFVALLAWRKLSDDEALLKATGVTRDVFETSLKKWHSKLVTVLVTAMSSGFGAHQKLALVFLHGVIDEFPNEELGGDEVLVARIDAIRKSVESLNTMAVGLLGRLRAKKKVEEEAVVQPAAAAGIYQEPLPGSATTVPPPPPPVVARERPLLLPPPPNVMAAVASKARRDGETTNRTRASSGPDDRRRPDSHVMNEPPTKRGRSDPIAIPPAALATFAAALEGNNNNKSGVPSGNKAPAASAYMGEISASRKADGGGDGGRKVMTSNRAAPPAATSGGNVGKTANTAPKPSAIPAQPPSSTNVTGQQNNGRTMTASAGSTHHSTRGNSGPGGVAPPPSTSSPREYALPSKPSAATTVTGNSTTTTSSSSISMAQAIIAGAQQQTVVSNSGTRKSGGKRGSRSRERVAAPPAPPNNNAFSKQQQQQPSGQQQQQSQRHGTSHIQPKRTNTPGSAAPPQQQPPQQPRQPAPQPPQPPPPRIQRSGERRPPAASGT